MLLPRNFGLFGHLVLLLRQRGPTAQVFAEGLPACGPERGLGRIATGVSKHWGLLR